MASPEALGFLPAGTARVAIALALPATLLTAGCASLPSKASIDPTAFRGRSIEVVVKPPPSFYADNKDRRRFGIVGVLVMAHEGNRQIRQHSLVDPSVALGASLEKAIERSEARARLAAAPSASSVGPIALASIAPTPIASTAIAWSDTTHGDPPRSIGRATGKAPGRTAADRPLAVTTAVAPARTAVAPARTVAPAAAVEPGNPAASSADLTLFVQTVNWEYRPFRGQRDQFYVIYSARVDLVDNRSGRLVARDRCEVTPTVDARLTEAELLADEARRLRAELAASSRLCLSALRSQPIATLLGLYPPLARR